MRELALFTIAFIAAFSVTYLACSLFSLLKLANKKSTAALLRRLADRLDPTPVQRAASIISEYLEGRTRPTEIANVEVPAAARVKLNSVKK